MNKLLNTALSLAFLFLFLFPEAKSQESQASAYRYHVDLIHLENGKVRVKLELPAVDVDTLEFQFPKIVPGTYSIYDFGRFIHDLEAFDAEGNPMPMDSLDANRRRLNQASKTKHLSYWVEDTYHSPQDNPVFEPAGTNIEEGKNFILNNHGFFGYLEGMKNHPFEIEVLRPKGFFGSSSLVPEHLSDSSDRFLAQGYFELADAPIMYCEPDTMVREIGGADILVSVYSPSGNLKADYVMDNIEEILDSQRKYMGGQLPIDRYAFIIYLFPGMSRSGAFGALEHNFSSLYSLPDVNPAYLTDVIRDVAAHEFFHIITPLNIHSEEIHSFDFINPKMSRHLWMYEGVTEYFAGHMQVAYDLISFDEYISRLRSKMLSSMEFDDTLAFTELSLGCLDEHEDQYPNVYQKGALIGLCLDLLLREQSRGRMGLIDLMDRLASRYGQDQPFKDEALFDEITEMTYPEVGTFFKRYVAGNEPLPLQEYFLKVGINYLPKEIKREVSMGNIGLGYNEKQEGVVVSDVSEMNEFGKQMGFEEGDIFLAINGQALNPESFAETIQQFKANTREGSRVVITISREQNGRWVEKKLKGKAIMIESEENHVIQPNDNADEYQLHLRNSWLMKK